MNRTIYTITNKNTNELYYVGSTDNFKKRSTRHRYFIKNPLKASKQLVMYNSLNEIGLDNIVIKAIDNGSVSDEMEYIGKLSPRYNVVKCPDKVEKDYDYAMYDPFAVGNQIEREHNKLAEDEYVESYITNTVGEVI